MNPNQNTGSFMSPAGVSADPIMEALQRRQTGGSPVTAQSSMTQTPTPMPVPQTNPSMGNVVPNSASVGGLPPKPAESELIIRALSDRLKTFSKIEESQAIPQQPQLGGI